MLVHNWLACACLKCDAVFSRNQLCWVFYEVYSLVRVEAVEFKLCLYVVEIPMVIFLNSHLRIYTPTFSSKSIWVVLTLIRLGLSQSVIEICLMNMSSSESDPGLSEISS